MLLSTISCRIGYKPVKIINYITKLCKTPLPIYYRYCSQFVSVYFKKIEQVQCRTKNIVIYGFIKWLKVWSTLNIFDLTCIESWNDMQCCPPWCFTYSVYKRIINHKPIKNVNHQFSMLKLGRKPYRVRKMRMLWWTSKIDNKNKLCENLLDNNNELILNWCIGIYWGIISFENVSKHRLKL